MKAEKNNATHLIIGKGEIGVSLYNVLKEHYNVSIRDKEDGLFGTFNVLHLCYPVLDNFIASARRYIDEYKPRLIIVHSTVPVGTTKGISDKAVHSPIRGIHPNLERGIKTFVKYFAGEHADEAAEFFSTIGIKTKSFKNSETTELMKILSTTYYAWNIVFQKEVKRICDEVGVNFDDVYTTANRDYNDGYKKLGLGQFVRPVLKDMPGPIEGHCLMSNCELLDDWITDVVKERNSSYEK